MVWQLLLKELILAVLLMIALMQHHHRSRNRYWYCPRLRRQSQPDAVYLERAVPVVFFLISLFNQLNMNF